MFFVTYLFFKVAALLLRTIPMVPSPDPKPDEVYEIQSRDPSRKIKAHAYITGPASEPRSILINFHGSGFVIPLHGADDEFCRLMNQRTGYTVLDIQYRLAPEHPFPAALNDVEDVIKWVLQQPDKFDRTRIALSGFSAGGNLALAASATLFPRDTFHGVISFYPLVDLYTNAGAKSAPDPSGRPLPTPLSWFFSRCYIPTSYDKRDPRISPLYAQPDRFPNQVLIFTASGDDLAPEAEKLAANIKRDNTRKVVCQRMEGCDHAFNLFPKTVADREATDRAYDMVATMLNGR